MICKASDRDRSFHQSRLFFFFFFFFFFFRSRDCVSFFFFFLGFFSCLIKSVEGGEGVQDECTYPCMLIITINWICTFIRL